MFQFVQFALNELDGFGVGGKCGDRKLEGDPDGCLDPRMTRRQFVVAAVPAAACVAAPVMRSADSTATGTLRGSFALDGTRVRIFTPAVRKPVRLLMVADTHLFRDDERGAPFVGFSGRMARAYNQTRHFATGEPTTPEASFTAALERAGEWRPGLLALVGDIVSFPSEAAVEWVVRKLASTGLAYQYTAGNHDWHYEGMVGSAAELRAYWSRERLAPLHQGKDPLMSVREVGGVRIVMLDNSDYEILPEQLEFFRKEVRTGKPLLLMVHIPLYAPGRSLGFGCGHPEWGGATDRNFALERRERWRATGHTEVTRAFHREAFGAANLLGVFAGHVHRPSLDLVNGIPQVVTEANAVGAWLEIEVLPVAT